MQLNNSYDPTYAQNINEMEFTERLFEYAKTFDFDSLNVDLLKNEAQKDKELEGRLIEFICGLIGYDYEELIQNLNFNRIETDSEKIKKLVEEQESGIKQLLISFVFELLPFSYLIKISEKRGKYQIKEDIREDIISILYGEIDKINNFNKTTEIVYDMLGAKAQKEQYQNISSKITSKSNTVMLENKFLIGLVDELPLTKLENLVDRLCASNLVWTNLHD